MVALLCGCVLVLMTEGHKEKRVGVSEKCIERGKEMEMRI